MLIQILRIILLSVVSNVGSFLWFLMLGVETREINVLVIDLDGLKSIYELKAIIKNFPNTKVLVLPV
jgi:hypothetical protein